jgi:hypothetical protein
VQGKVIPERHPGTYSSLPGGSSTHPSLDVWLWPIATLPQELMPANAPKALKHSDAGAVRPSAFKALVEIRSY